MGLPRFRRFFIYFFRGMHDAPCAENFVSVSKIRNYAFGDVLIQKEMDMKLQQNN